MKGVGENTTPRQVKWSQRPRHESGYATPPYCRFCMPVPVRQRV